MIFFTISAIALGLATFTSAHPTTRQLSSGEFSLTLSATGYPALSLNAVDSAITGTKNLLFESQTAYSGTPAYLNSTYLDFDLGESSPYAMYFQEVGDDYGISVPVTAVLGQSSGRAGFGVYDTEITATLHAALESFFACNKTIDGEEVFALSWGVFNSNGSSPTGCVIATLIQSFNVE